MSNHSITDGQLLIYIERYNQAKLSLGVALILCTAFGSLGLHKFYLKQNIAGILYFCFCWTLIPTIFSMIDLFLLRSQVTRYNNILAVEILSSINPNSSPELIKLHLQKYQRFWYFVPVILLIALVTVAITEIYHAVSKELTPLDSLYSLVTNPKSLAIPGLTQEPAPTLIQNKRYRITYDGLQLGMSIEAAKEEGYNQCTKSEYYSICSNIKHDYPNFYSFPVNFAMAKFDNQDRLIMIYLYFNQLPSYQKIVTKIAAEQIGNKTHTDYLRLAGSNEELFMDIQESNLAIGDKEILQDYNKQIAKQKLLNSSTP